MFRGFKFSAKPDRPTADKRNETASVYAAAVVCILVYYIAGAHWPMIIASMLTYIVLRLRYTTRRR